MKKPDTGTPATHLASAKAFLVESIRNQEARNRPFAIVNGVTAVELVLKERLARIKPALIWKNIDADRQTRTDTVALRDLPQRLSNLGVSVGAKETALIRQFAGWRNQVVHHVPDFDAKAADVQFPQLVDFIAVFLRSELGTPLETFLPRELYRVAASLLQDWRTVVHDAQGRAGGEGNVLAYACPNCSATAVLTLRQSGQVYCHLCRSGQFWYDVCVECSRPVVVRLQEHGRGNLCSACLDARQERTREWKRRIDDETRE